MWKSDGTGGTGDRTQPKENTEKKTTPLEERIKEKRGHRVGPVGSFNRDGICSRQSFCADVNMDKKRKRQTRVRRQIRKT